MKLLGMTVLGAVLSIVTLSSVSQASVTIKTVDDSPNGEGIRLAGKPVIFLKEGGSLVIFGAPVGGGESRSCTISKAMAAAKGIDALLLGSLVASDKIDLYCRPGIDSLEQRFEVMFK